MAENTETGRDKWLGTWLQEVATDTEARFLEAHEAREQTLRFSREVIRKSANSIRATHRGEFDRAKELLAQVGSLASEMEKVREAHPRVYYAGFVEDALKEFAEASVTLALARGSRPPTADELGMGAAPYVNGLAETVGELRRSSLDSLRKDEFSRCEVILDMMDEVYAVLVTMDFPEAVTGGLRRRTAAARGILERTRGDITLALRQHRLQEELARFQETVQKGK